jgi:hypothetical protein
MNFQSHLCDKSSLSIYRFSVIRGISYTKTDFRLSEIDYLLNGTLYCIQLSSWRNEKIANDEAKNLLSKGFDSFVAIVELPNNGGIRYRVRVGYFTSLEEAQIIKKLILK